MELVQHLDFWLAMFTLAAVIFVVLKDSVWPFIRPIFQILGAIVGWLAGAAIPQRSQDLAEDAPLRRRSRVRSRPLRGYRARSGQANVQNGVQQRSPRLNAESQSVQRSASVQNVQHAATNLPQNADELRKLAHAIALYSQRPNKQLAIETAWGCSKGEGPIWQRASALFDAAAPPRLAKAGKAAVEDELKMEPVP